MISLATRGYLWAVGAGQIVIGPGPIIARAEAPKPEMKGAAYTAPAGPDISGSAIRAPTISGGGTTPTTPPSTPPSISGGGTLVPGGGKKR